MSELEKSCKTCQYRYERQGGCDECGPMWQWFYWTPWESEVSAQASGEEE